MMTAKFRKKSNQIKLKKTRITTIEYVWVTTATPQPTTENPPTSRLIRIAELRNFNYLITSIQIKARPLNPTVRRSKE